MTVPPEIDNMILVGDKDAEAYVQAIQNQAFYRGYPEVRVLARGRAISKAVDVSEIALRCMPGWLKTAVKTSTVTRDDPHRADTNGGLVSQIEIVLTKDTTEAHHASTQHRENHDNDRAMGG